MFSRLSVQGRFFLFVIPLLVGALTLATVAYMVKEVRVHGAEIHQRAQLLARLLVQQVGPPLVTGDHRAADSAVDQVSREPGVVFIAIQDRSGRVVQERGDSDLRAVRVSTLVEVGGEEFGRVVVGVDDSPVREEIRSIIVFSSLLGLGVAIILLIGIRIALRRQVIEPLTRLLEIAQAAGSTLDLKKLLPLLARKAAQACRADRCTIFLVKEGRVVPVISQFADGHRDEEMWRAFKELGEWRVEEAPILSVVCQRRQPLVAPARSDLIPPAWRETFGMKSLLSIPLVVGDECIGVMHLDYTDLPRSFSQDQIHLASTVAGQAVLAIDNARLFEESERLRTVAQASEERFRDLVQGLDAIVWEADAGSLQFSFISRRAEELLGYPVERWLTEPGFCVARIHPDDREQAVSFCREATLEGEDHQLEYRVLAADGSAVWLRNMVRVVTDDSGKARQLRGVMVEITERKRAEQRQATQFAVTRILAESATVGEAASNLLRAICEGVGWDLGELWRHDATDDALHRESVWHSPSISLGEFEEISRGLTFSRGVGLPGTVWDTGQPLWKTDVVTDPKFPRMRAAARAGLHGACGFPIRTPGEGTGVMVFFSRMLRESDQDLLRMMDDLGSQIGQFIERKRAEEALAVTNRSLEAKNEELEAFVYTVTHDLRAPLVALQGMAGMLLEEKGGQLDAEGQHYLGRLVRNTAHMEELIRDLLEFSRVGRLPRSPGAVTVAEVVDGILLQHGEAIREKGIKVSCRDLPVLWGERTRVEQIFANLIGNALKFLGADNPAPMIEVGAEDRGGEWECYVKDNGIGIDPAYHGKVLELFQRLREVETEGTGVGLAIVKKIVDLAGGKMWIESEAGKGATFRFTWPKVVGKGE